MTKSARLRGTGTRHQNTGQAVEVKSTVLGDIGFADDTAIVGSEDEVAVAEQILQIVMQDWEEKLHPDKTERLRMSGTVRGKYDVRKQGEVHTARHVGGWVSETNSQRMDTRQKAIKGWAMSKKKTGAWSLGTRSGRGRTSGLSITTRLDVMRATVVPCITSFARSRAWSKGQLTQIERVPRYAVRRALGMDIYAMREHHVLDDMLYQAAGWSTMADTIRRLSMEWVGHIARMPTHRLPKQVLFGWWASRRSKFRYGVV